MFRVVDERAGRLVWVAFTLCDESFVEGGYREEEGASVDDDVRGTSSLQGQVGEVPAFEVYLWAGRILSVELKLPGGKEGMVAGLEPAIKLKVDVDDWTATGNVEVLGLEQC